jgi:hypothetical protein
MGEVNAVKRARHFRPSSVAGGALVALAVLGVSIPASAQKKSNVITIGEVTIVGRVQKPIASVDVSKIQPKLTLAELRQPFLDRIEEAVGRDPF